MARRTVDLLDPDRLDALRSRRRIPAIGAAVVDPSGVRLAVAGSTGRDGADPVREDDSWHIGSCTKSLTAALYGRLVEQGRADWDVSVAALLPDLEVHPGWRDRTVSELLWCRAGVAANLDVADLASWQADPRPLPEQRTEATRQALGPAPASPGRFVYSNLGYIVLGAAIDRIAGSFEDALRVELLDPLGVSSAGWGPPPRLLGHPARHRLGPWTLGRGGPVRPEAPAADNPPVMASAGTLHLPLADWGRVHRLFQADAPGPLTEQTVSRLLAVPSAPGRGMAMGWARTPDGLAGMQGSNTLWSASAILSRDHRRTALVVANDGRRSVLTATALAAVQLAGRP